MDDEEEMKTQCFGGDYMGEVSWIIISHLRVSVLQQTYLLKFVCNKYYIISTFSGVWPHVKEDELSTSEAMVECIHAVLYAIGCWGKCANEESEWAIIV
jgi:hypothetical protein